MQHSHLGVVSMLRLVGIVFVSTICVIGAPSTSRSQTGPRTPADIVAAFVRTERQVRNDLNQHTVKRDVVLQTIGPNGEVTGEYIRNSQFVFDDDGNRIERVTYHPPSTIREMRITKEDIQDLAGAQLLGIDILDSAKYQLSYAGRETLAGKLVDRLLVEPAVKPNPYRMSERYFRGSV